MLNIEMTYFQIENDLRRIFSLVYDNIDGACDEYEVARTESELIDTVKKAKLYDILKYKHAQGGKKSANNMTAKERTERARKAGKAKKSRCAI